MADFEWTLTHAFNEFFLRNRIEAIAYRLKQFRYTSQAMDVLVDSIDPKYYLAIECKSLDARKIKTLYFSQHFNSSGNIHQIDRETEFLKLSGRHGILAVELRRGAGKTRSAHLIPWTVVRSRFEAEYVGLTLEEIETYPSLERNGGCYEIVDWNGYHRDFNYDTSTEL